MSEPGYNQADIMQSEPDETEPQSKGSAVSTNHSDGENYITLSQTALTGKTYSTPRYVQSCHTLEYELIKDQIHIQTHHLHKVTALLSKIPTATTLKSFGCHDDNRKLRGLPWRVKSTQITQKHTQTHTTLKTKWMKLHLLQLSDIFYHIKHAFILLSLRLF